jgi:dipeptidyl aminopeptidase/acylaminoacyl peptidase
MIGTIFSMKAHRGLVLSGISDTLTDYVNTDINPFIPQYLRATHWDDREIYAKTSPITTIKLAKTPTLIQQGSNDKRVPVPNAYELYRVYRTRESSPA